MNFVDHQSLLKHNVCTRNGIFTYFYVYIMVSRNGKQCQFKYNQIETFYIYHYNVMFYNLLARTTFPCH